MRIADIFRFAGRNFLRRKARSLLTILGVVIGTMSVVIMLSIGEALNVGQVRQMEQYGSLTVLTINRGWGNEEAPKLTDKLVEQVRDLGHVVAVNPVRSMQFSTTFIKDRTETWGQIMSVDAETLPLFGYDLEVGRYMEGGGGYELVVGYSMPFQFMDPRNPVWTDPYDWEAKVVNPLPFDPTQETIKLRPVSYVEPGKPKPKDIKVSVVGVLEFSQDYTFAYGALMDGESFDKLEAEIKKIQDRMNEGSEGPSGGRSPSPSTGEEVDKYDQILIKADNMDNVVTLMGELVNTVGIPQDQVYSPIEELERMRESTAFIQYILGGIGLVAFLVAALGIANTMIMSTYERTREIGIMKVMGCKLNDILNMFLSESAIIGLFGGILGVLLSVVTSIVLNRFVGGAALNMTSMTGESYDLSIIPAWLYLVSLVFTTAVGVLSGLYPSVRAMRMSALEAIKNE